MGVKRKETTTKKEPLWKKRISEKIKTMRKDLSRLDRWNKKELYNERMIEGLGKKYNVKNKRLKVVIEELKQRVVATSEKLKRYENKAELFERLEKVDRSNDLRPDSEESKRFWSEIWDQPVLHNNNAGWLKKVEKDLENVTKQEDIKISINKVKKQLRKMKNWKAPGPDRLQGFWIKRFVSCHERVTEQLQGCLEMNDTPDWLTRGRTTLIIKDKAKRNDVANFRPITCVPLMWKLFTGILGDEMYEHFERENLLPEEQKGCRRKSRGTKDQLLIDKMILKNCKRRQTGLGMAWIDYKKAYDMIPHSWLQRCMVIFGVADNMYKVLLNSMEKSKSDLTAGGENLGTVNIRRGIFQGDSSSPLLFVLALIPLTLVLKEVKVGYDLGRGQGKVNHLLFMDDLKLYGKNENEADTLINTVRIFCNDIGMEFGISKCAILIMKRGKMSRSEGIEMPDNQVIKGLNEGEGYKYLGVLEADGFKNEEMKGIVSKEYFRRIKTILRSKLNAGNTIKAINSRAVAVVRYGAGLIKWTKDGLRNIDRKTRKLMTLYRALHPQADVDRLYLRREEGGKGMIGVEDCVEIEVKSLSEYVNVSTESLIRAVKAEEILGDGKTKREILEKRKNQYMRKNLHSQFMKNTEEVRESSTWNWLRKGTLKKETEGCPGSGFENKQH